MVVYQVQTPHRKKSFVSNLSITTKLIIINVLCYILFMILMSLDILSLDYIAINPRNILAGKYVWTFVTSIFMHGGIFHLFANMLSLYFIGNLVERILGYKRYLWFYMISGLIAGLLFVVSPFLFSQDFSTYAVGASGALFGLIGILIILTPDLPVYLMFVPVPIKMKYAGPGMLVLLWAISLGADIPIGNVAHLGGIIAGVIYGFYLRQKFPNKTDFIAKRFS